MPDPIEDSENIWECKIGGLCGPLPDGADWPMRKAVQEAYGRITGRPHGFCFSGWGGSLDAVERSVLKKTAPPPTSDDPRDVIAMPDPTPTERMTADERAEAIRLLRLPGAALVREYVEWLRGQLDEMKALAIGGSEEGTHFYWRDYAKSLESEVKTLRADVEGLRAKLEDAHAAMDAGIADCHVAVRECRAWREADGRMDLIAPVLDGVAIDHPDYSDWYVLKVNVDVAKDATDASGVLDRYQEETNG